MPEKAEMGAVQWVLSYSQEFLMVPLSCGQKNPHKGLIACGRLKLIKNNCLARAVNVPWQNPIAQQAQAAWAVTTALLLLIRNPPAPGGPSSCGEVRPHIRAFWIMREGLCSQPWALCRHKLKTLGTVLWGDAATLHFPSGERED